MPATAGGTVVVVGPEGRAATGALQPEAALYWRQGLPVAARPQGWARRLAERRVASE